VSTGITPDTLNALLPPFPTPPPYRLTLVLARVLDHYILWSLPSDPQQPVRQYILTATPDSISQRTATFLRLCADPHSSVSDLNLLGRSLYNDLLAPADAQLAQIRDISLDVDPSLAALPFAALQRRDHYLGVDYALTFLTNSWILHAYPSAATDHFPAHANLALLEESLTDSHAIIPTDYDESADIQRLFPNARVERATLSRDGPELAVTGSPGLRGLLAQADGIHYVGHGLEDTPSQSEQNAGDPMLKLSIGTLPHTRLAVLAACQTLHEREDTAVDVPSFARIVMAAGATHVLATQWDVDSRMTSQLMQHFYAALAAGASFSDALRQSQQSLQHEPTSAHPYFWSGFQLVGSS
jgi:CHAT domain-containing protein